MRLAECVADIAFLQGMSLRQAYARLGVPTEPKTPSMRGLSHRLPVHIVLAGKLVRALKRRPGKTVEEQVEGYRLDLRTLYEKLRPWFESAPILRTGANFNSLTGSHKP